MKVICQGGPYDGETVDVGLAHGTKQFILSKPDADAGTQEIATYQLDQAAPRGTMATHLRSKVTPYDAAR